MSNEKPGVKMLMRGLVQGGVAKQGWMSHIRRTELCKANLAMPKALWHTGGT